MMAIVSRNSRSNTSSRVTNRLPTDGHRVLLPLRVDRSTSGPGGCQHSQECSTRYRIQSEPVKEDALIPSGDSYFQRLFGFQLHRCMGWGQPTRRSLPLQGASDEESCAVFEEAISPLFGAIEGIKLTSVSYGGQIHRRTLRVTSQTRLPDNMPTSS